MSERTVADDTLTPGASTTCCDPTGWADPMYSATTALRMADLRASSPPLAAVLSSVRLSSLVGMGVTVGGANLVPGESGVSCAWCWHSTLVSADPFRAAARGARRPIPSDEAWSPGPLP